MPQLIAPTGVIYQQFGSLWAASGIVGGVGHAPLSHAAQFTLGGQSYLVFVGAKGLCVAQRSGQDYLPFYTSKATGTVLRVSHVGTVGGEGCVVVQYTDRFLVLKVLERRVVERPITASLPPVIFGHTFKEVVEVSGIANVLVDGASRLVDVVLREDDLVVREDGGIVALDETSTDFVALNVSGVVTRNGMRGRFADVNRPASVSFGCLKIDHGIATVDSTVGSRGAFLVGATVRYRGQYLQIRRVETDQTLWRLMTDNPQLSDGPAPLELVRRGYVNPLSEAVYASRANGEHRIVRVVASDAGIAVLDGTRIIGHETPDPVVLTWLPANGTAKHHLLGHFDVRDAQMVIYGSTVLAQILTPAASWVAEMHDGDQLRLTSPAETMLLSV